MSNQLVTMIAMLAIGYWLLEKDGIKKLEQLLGNLDFGGGGGGDGGGEKAAPPAVAEQ